jgi:hypothetical protein
MSAEIEEGEGELDVDVEEYSQSQSDGDESEAGDPQGACPTVVSPDAGGTPRAEWDLGWAFIFFVVLRPRVHSV